MPRVLLNLLLGVCIALAASGCRSPKRPVATIDSAQPITILYTDTYGLLRYEGHPVIRGSINGVSGMFVIDTGATIPILTLDAARQCGFKAYWPSPAERTNRFWGGDQSMMKATNIVVELAPGFTVRLPETLVAGEAGFFGIVDYRTLKEAHAVIDTKKKTVTFTK